MHCIVSLLLTVLLQTAPSSAPATGQRVLTWPFPSADQFEKRIGPIARNYRLSTPGKSFAKLRAMRVTPDGQVREANANGDLANLPSDSHEYDVYIPANYAAGEKSFGLIVWIEPEPGFGSKSPWKNVLDERQIIYIAPRHVPNESHSVWRIFMALESVRHARDEFNIDLDRIYIAGLSGGGRISSHAAVFFPDVFSGALCIVGSNYYRDTPAGGNRIYPGFWPSPNMQIIQRGRENSRLVLMTGSKDFNQPSTKAAYEAYEKDGWQHVTYLEIPEMAHQMPNAESFDQAVATLDSPVYAGARSQYDRATALEKKKKLGEACIAFESAARHGGEQSFVADAMQRAASIRKLFNDRCEVIERLMEQKKLDDAAARSRQLKSDFAPLADDRAADFIERIRAARAQKK